MRLPVIKALSKTLIFFLISILITVTLFDCALAIDSDNDGLEDSEEIKAHTDINDADSADFHVLAEKLGCRADDIVGRLAGNLDDIIGNQAMPSFDQIERTFGFTDTGLTGIQQPDAVDVDQRTVHGNSRGESVVQVSRKPRH